MSGISGVTDAADSSLSAMQLWEKTIELNKLKNDINRGAEGQTSQANKLENEIRTGKVECATCASRKYVDRSDDPSVSFQTPKNISPGQSLGKVMGHELEHVRNESADAARENKKVLKNSVTLQYAICPECGARYVAGGETTTVTKTEKEIPDENLSAQNGRPANGQARNTDNRKGFNLLI